MICSAQPAPNYGGVQETAAPTDASQDPNMVQSACGVLSGVEGVGPQFRVAGPETILQSQILKLHRYAPGPEMSRDNEKADRVRGYIFLQFEQFLESVFLLEAPGVLVKVWSSGTSWAIDSHHTQGRPILQQRGSGDCTAILVLVYLDPFSDVVASYS